MGQRQVLQRPLTAVLPTNSGAVILEEYVDSSGNIYIPLYGVASLAAGSWVTFDPVTGLTTLATKAEVDKLKPMAVSMMANTSTTTLSWFMVKGEATALVLASCAKEVALYSSGTAGSLDDDSTSQTKINRAVATATRGGTNGTTTIHIVYPYAA